MEPVEIRGRLRAFEKNAQNSAQKSDRDAWMIGYYVRLAQNAKKYPRKPSLVKIKKEPKPEEADTEDMQDKIGMFAQAHNAAEEAKHL